MSGAAAEDEGRIPRTIAVELTADLVDAASVGDIVRVLGFVKVLNADVTAGPSAQKIGHRGLWNLGLAASS